MRCWVHQPMARWGPSTCYAIETFAPLRRPRACASRMAAALIRFFFGWKNKKGMGKVDGCVMFFFNWRFLKLWWWFHIYLLFSCLIWGRFPFWLSYFSNGLEPPTWKEKKHTQKGKPTASELFGCFGAHFCGGVGVGSGGSGKNR